MFLNMYKMTDMSYVSMKRITYLKYGIYGIVLLLATTIALVPNFLTKKPSVTPRTKFPTDLKYILFWDEKKKIPFGKMYPEYEFTEGQTLFIKQKCEYINCFITYNKALLKNDYNFDAIVFDIRQVRQHKTSYFNLTRAPDQKYIFRSLLPSENRPICYSQYETFFNLTWTYKLDSDIPHPFMNIYNFKNNTLVGPATNVSWILSMDRVDKYSKKMQLKNKTVAWIVNDCNLKATHSTTLKLLRQELESYNYTLDTYGNCGDNKCPKGGIYKCFKMIEKEYFFQLVFEDAFAEDYVTDKLVKVMQLDIIPIVSGGADYRRFLPPGTYLNIGAFDIKTLGAIIDHLVKHPKVYTYFFDWKNHYTYNLRPKDYVCDLCTALNKNLTENPSRRFRYWWNPYYEDVCVQELLYHKFAKESKDYNDDYF